MLDLPAGALQPFEPADVVEDVSHAWVVSPTHRRMIPKDDLNTYHQNQKVKGSLGPNGAGSAEPETSPGYGPGL